MERLPRSGPPLSAFAGQTVLITGSGGLIGGAVAEALSGVDCRIIRLSRRELPPLQGRALVETVVGDLTKPGDWQACVAEANCIFHLAAQTSVYEARKSPGSDLTVNVMGLLNLLEAMRAARHRISLVMAGTVTEAGMPRSLPVDEKVPDRPITFYDLSKLTAENYLKLYVAEGWLSGACLRLANIYGGTASSVRADRGVLDKVLSRALNGESITIFGDGAWLRDYLFIDDAVAAFLHAGAAPQQVSGRHFIIGSGVGISLKSAFGEAVAVAAEHTGRRVPIEHAPAPEGLSPIEFRNFVADIGAFSEATGWSPRFSLREGLCEALRRRLTLSRMT